MDRCSRCHRRLTGLVSMQLGIGPVCIKKNHRHAEEEASRAQADLFAGELVVADLSTRVQALLARINALEAKA